MKKNQQEYTSSTSLNNYFISACYNNNLEEVKRLNSKYKPKLKSNNKFFRIAQNILNKFKKDELVIDVHYYDDRCFRYACDQGHLEVVKYLLTSDEMVEKCNINAEDDYGVRISHTNGHTDVLKFLVLEMNIDKTESIRNYIEKNNATDLDDLFQKRELYKNLSNEIVAKPVEQRKKLKI